MNSYELLVYPPATDAARLVQEGPNLKMHFGQNLSLVDLKRGVLKFVEGRESVATKEQVVMLSEESIVIGTGKSLPSCSLHTNRCPHLMAADDILLLGLRVCDPANRFEWLAGWLAGWSC